MSSLGETGYASPVQSGYLSPAATSPPYLPRLPPPPQSQPVMMHGAFYPTHPPAPYPQYQVAPSPPGFYPTPSQGAFNSNGYYPSVPYPPRPFFRGRYPRRGRGQSVIKGHYECKVCSKEYKTEENYSAHLESHQKVKCIVLSSILFVTAFAECSVASVIFLLCQKY